MAWCAYHDAQTFGTDVHCVWYDPAPGLCADAEQLHCLCVQVVC